MAEVKHLSDWMGLHVRYANAAQRIRSTQCQCGCSYPISGWFRGALGIRREKPSSLSDTPAGFLWMGSSPLFPPSHWAGLRASTATMAAPARVLGMTRTELAARARSTRKLLLSALGLFPSIVGRVTRRGFGSRAMESVNVEQNL